MLNRNVPLAVCLSVIAGAAFAQTSSNQGTGYIFEFADSASASGQFQGFVYNTGSLGTPVFNATGPAGAHQVIAKPDGSEFYVVGTGGIDDFNPTFTSPATINGISGTPTQVIITPDGRYLLIATNAGAGASTFYVLNTTTNEVVFTQAISGSVIGIVASRDATTAWILGGGSYPTFITTLNLSTLQQVGSPVILRDPQSGDVLVGNPTSMSLSPLGLLYVTGGNEILEITPASLQAATLAYTSIPVSATPGPLQFSTDGSVAYFINTTPQYGGESLLSMTLPGHALNFWPPYIPGQTVEVFDSIVIAAGTSTGPTRLFAHSPADTILWDVAPDFSSVVPSALNSVIPATSVLSIALSNEIPTAQYLYTLVAAGSAANLYRVALSTNTVSGEASAALGPGTLQFSIVPPETNPSGFIQYNASQTLSAGATAAPLIARVLDPTGRPMFAVPVTFTDPSGTLKFAGGGTPIAGGVAETSDEDGYVQTTVTVGTTPGSYPVTLTAGSGTSTVTTTFALIIPGGTVGPTGGTSQVVIVAGNGQLWEAYDSHFNGILMTVQVNDTNGNPLPNVAVAFTVTGPNIGAVTNPNAVTGTNGQASTDFQPEGPPENTAFQSTTITAVATEGALVLGSVTFEATVFQLNPDGLTGGPIVTMAPPVGSTITAGEGDVVPSALVAQIFSGAYTGGPIPNVGIRIADPTNPIANGPGTCQGNPLSDTTGTVTCNFIASCSAGIGQHGFFISIGEFLDEPDYSVNIVPGSTHALAIQSGNNQSGRPAAELNLPLTVTVTDKCGVPAQGAVVTWQVVSGSATLSTTSTTSNQGGAASVNVTLGQVAGTVQIVASLNSSTIVTFTETIQAVVGSLKLISGDNQSALLNTAFTAPLVFQLSNSSNSPIPGLVVNFSLASGSASLSPTSATTNAQGQVSVTVTAGNVTGPVTILATYSTFTASGTLTVTSPGLPLTVSSFVNAGSGQAGLTPCGLALVTGTGLAPNITGITLPQNPLGIGPLPITLSGVTITINGIPAPLQAVSNQNGIQQVNFQTPCELVTGSPATVVVQVGAVSTQITGVTVYPAQPGVFTFAGPGGVNYGWVINATNGSTLTATNLATPGQTYYLIATGLGQTTPPAATDSPGTGETIPASTIVLAINNVGVPVTSVEYAEGAFGEYVITFQIPVPFAAGTNLPISLGVTVNGQTFYDTSPVALPGIN
jgi:uncharacterized protein (TIGR03437 family)